MQTIRCIKDWYMNGKLIFEKEWLYPVIKKEINGDKGIIGYKVKYDEEDGYPLGIWFWSGSEYFEIKFLK